MAALVRTVDNRIPGSTQQDFIKTEPAGLFSAERVTQAHEILFDYILVVRWNDSI